MLRYSMKWDDFEFNFHMNRFLFHAYSEFLVYLCFAMMEEIVFYSIVL